MRLRREGKVTQEESRASAKRPMGAMSNKTLREAAQSIDTHVEKAEREFRQNPDNVHMQRLVKAKNQRNSNR